MRLFSVAHVLLLTHLAYAHEFKTITRFGEIPNPDQPGTLIALDLDETVMKPVGHLGSEKWYQEFAASVQLNHTLAMRRWNRLQSHLEMQPIDALIAQWIQARQAQQIPVIGLTARRPKISTATLKQLKKLGIDFTHFSELNGGVLFVGEKNPKGNALTRFIESQHLSVSRIIFVDNYTSNLESVQSALSASGIQYEPYHFVDISSCNTLFQD
jgi:hypothetical protein